MHALVCAQGFVQAGSIDLIRPGVRMHGVRTWRLAPGGLLAAGNAGTEHVLLWLRAVWILAMGP